MKQTRLFPIDHGNKNIKTLNEVFTAGFRLSNHLPGIGSDTLVYNGNEYVLVDVRLPNKTDKTTDDDFFILTLFAIGKELYSFFQSQTSASQEDCLEIELLIGLPPLLCKKHGQRFKDYFTKRKGPIEFTFNEIPVIIEIVDVHVFPQAYAAAVTVFEDFKNVRTINVVDVGGYTVDLLQLINLRPNMTVCNSLYYGANTLFQRINDQVRANGEKNMPESTIEGILLGDKKVLDECADERISLIHYVARQFTADMIAEILQAGLDLAENLTLFVGGGAILLEKQIEMSGLVANAHFVRCVHANARGYKLLHEIRTDSCNMVV